MQKKPIQFQRSLGLHEFLEQSGTEEQSRQAPYTLCWPEGYACPKCGNRTGGQLKRRPIYQCHKCRNLPSLTAVSIFHGTKLALNKWFPAIYLLPQSKKITSALQLSREIRVNYNIAWKFKHKFMQVIMERERGKRLSGRIEMDDTYLGGEKPDKRSRGSRKLKTCFLYQDQSFIGN